MFSCAGLHGSGGGAFQSHRFQGFRLKGFGPRRATITRAWGVDGLVRCG